MRADAASLECGTARYARNHLGRFVARRRGANARSITSKAGSHQGCMESLGKMETYWIFEGGGAKGIGHVGAYAWMSKFQGVQPKGVAGTSAGAIIASLIAAGYRRDEIFDPEQKEAGKRGLLDMDDTVRMFGFHWKWWFITYSGLIRKIPRRWYWTWVRWPLIAVWIVLFPVLSRFGWGFFRTVRFEQWLESKLREVINRDRLENERIERPIRFSDLPIRLCVVATNLSRRTLVVLDEDAEKQIPELTVARAVAASIAIPVFFRPVRLQRGDDLYVDGGVTSNFPVWMFEHAREDFGRRTPVIGVQLLDAAPLAPLSDAFDILGTLISTAISGAQRIESLRIKNLNLIQISTAVRTLDFNMGSSARDALYFAGYEAARRLLMKRPQLANAEVVTRFLDAVQKELESLLGNPKHLRVNVILPVSDTHLMVYFTSSSMSTMADTDDCLIFTHGQGATGTCFAEKRAVHCDLSDEDNRVPGAWQLDKYQQALVRRSLKSLLAIPILRVAEGRAIGEEVEFEDLEAVGTLNIDSDEDLNQTFALDSFQMKCLDLVSSYIKPALAGEGPS
jgi:NTE family protein